MAWLFLSLVPSGVGFVLFSYGRKQDRWPMLVAGLAFMVYPYFTSTVTAMATVGAVLGLGLYATVRAGY
jgi:hypothetical protein